MIECPYMSVEVASAMPDASAFAANRRDPYLSARFHAAVAVRLHAGAAGPTRP